MISSCSRALAPRGVLSCLVGLVLLTAACTSAPPAQLSLAHPQPKGHRTQALGAGYPGTASFDAPVVDPNTWQGTPIGTGTWSVSSTPTSTGGPDAVGAVDSSSGTLTHYVMIADFHAGPGQLFAVVSDGLLSVGAWPVNNSTLYAGVFDANTGDPISLATSGTVTLTAAGGIGGRLTGSFTGTLDDVAPPPAACTTNANCASGEICVGGVCQPQPPGCTSSAQCRPGELCVSGQCVTQPSGCTTNAQCAGGQVCVNGQCASAPGCTTNAQCAGGQVCVNGQCASAPGCTSNAQCGGGQVCQSGQCVTQPGGCTSNAQCASGQVCSAGRCVGSPPASCNAMQGSGDYAGSVGSAAVCSVFGSGAISVTPAAAGFGDDGQGGLMLYVMDPNRDTAGVVLPLSACPSSPVTLSITGATFWDETTSGGATFYASRPAASATVTFSQVAAHIQGTFALSFTGGGQLSGSFDVQ